MSEESRRTHDNPLPECLERFKNQAELLKEVRESQHRIEECLLGNGSPEKGLAMRVALLENSEARRRWFTNTTLGGMIVIALKVVWDMIQHLGPQKP